MLRPGGRFIFSVNVPDPRLARIAFHGVPSFFTSRNPIKFFRNSMRMLRYGKWLKQEAAGVDFTIYPEKPSSPGSPGPASSASSIASALPARRTSSGRTAGLRGACLPSRPVGRGE